MGMGMFCPVIMVYFFHELTIQRDILISLEYHINGDLAYQTPLTVEQKKVLFAVRRDDSDDACGC